MTLLRDVFITATSKEVDELIESQCEVIALDATLQQRPKETLDELVSYIRTHATQMLKSWLYRDR